uniref:Mechanosensitive ion channel protein n=1 Tax=Araucaria cunninghamii TaxID=56994 RepID=A0A0D6QRW5_ARACU
MDKARQISEARAPNYGTDKVVLNVRGCRGATSTGGEGDDPCCGKEEDDEEEGGGFKPPIRPIAREMALSDVSAIHGGDEDNDPARKREVDVVSNAEEMMRTPSRVPTLSRALLSKPKSRFVETRHQLSPLYVNTVHESATKRSPWPIRGEREMPSSELVTPRSAAAAGGAGEVEDDDDDDADPFKDDDLPAKYRKREIGVWVLLEWIAAVVLITTMVCILTLPPLEHRMMRGLQLWKWCLMIFVVLCGRLVSGWGISILVFCVERNFMLRKRILYFVYGLRQSVQNCLWLGLVILAWNLLFDPRLELSTKNHKALSYVTRLLASFLVATVLWLLKVLLVKVMSSTFHVNTFFDRIQESIFHQYVLETLSGRPIMDIQHNMADERKPSKNFSNGNMAKVIFRSAEITRRKGGWGKGHEKTRRFIYVDQLHKMNPKNISLWNMKRLIKVIRYSGISTMSDPINDSVSRSGHQRDKEITSELEAMAAAKNIFKNVAKPGAKYIEEKDLLRFLKMSEVASIFSRFEGATHSGNITKSALKNWMVNVYLERKSLAHSLNDAKTAVKQLHQIINGVVIIIITVVVLFVLGIATTHVIVLLSSQLVLAGLIFGNTCKTIFEAIVFVFIMHPFDVGDRCVVDGVQMVVEEMNILTTVFLQPDNDKVYYPNSALATKPISNFYRSPDMGDSVEFTVDVSTPVEKIGSLEERIAKYMESKPQHWHAQFSVEVKEIEKMNDMKMGLYVLHTMNHQNMGEKANRRSELVLEMKKSFEELAIKYHLLPQKVHLKFVGSLLKEIPLNADV